MSRRSRVSQWIRSTAKTNNPRTQIEVLHHCTAQYGEVIARLGVIFVLIAIRDPFFENESATHNEVQMHFLSIFFGETIWPMAEAVPAACPSASSIFC
jgi:hypothetical protein